MTPADPVAALAEQRLSHRDKGIPVRAAGMTVRDFLAAAPRLSEFWTPLLVIDDETLEGNLAAMAAWCARNGFGLMPHGKTTMAPALWRRQLGAGAAGITVATAGQVRIARAFGVHAIQLANELVDPRGLRYVAGELSDPGFRFTCWADSVETVEAMERELAGIPLDRPIDVCVELGAPGGRTGARTIEDAVAVATRIRRSGSLRLAGVAGYEGAVGHGRSDSDLAAVRRYLQSMLDLHARLHDLYDDGRAMLTAGGSAYFDLVAEVFAPTTTGMPRTDYVLRAGAYITHDHGFYRSISPLDPSRPDAGAGMTLAPAARGYARVVSRPEDGLAFLDAGKRDFPYDEGLPIPIAVAPDLGSAASPMSGAEVVKLNDQHTFLRIEPASALPVGSVVELGLSHPCTMFDKWRFIPVVRRHGSDEVVDLVQTFF